MCKHGNQNFVLLAHLFFSGNITKHLHQTADMVILIFQCRIKIKYRDPLSILFDKYSFTDFSACIFTPVISIFIFTRGNHVKKTVTHLPAAFAKEFISTVAAKCFRSRIDFNYVPQLVKNKQTHRKTVYNELENEVVIAAYLTAIFHIESPLV